MEIENMNKETPLSVLFTRPSRGSRTSGLCVIVIGLSQFDVIETAVDVECVVGGRRGKTPVWEASKPIQQSVPFYSRSQACLSVAMKRIENRQTYFR